jgi:sugar lactone lactonase YvrE
MMGRQRASAWRGLTFAACVLLCNCSGAGSGSSFVRGAATIETKGTENIYLSNYLYNNVAVYGPSETVPAYSITDGISQPDSLAVDIHGVLYVANQTAYVTVYPIGAEKPSRTISQGVDGPSAVVVDREDRVYVANAAANTVTIYGPGGKRPLRTLTEGIAHPIALALDKKNDIYVSNASSATRANSIVEYGPDGRKLLRTLTQGVVGYTFIAVDRNDHLYAASEWESMVTEFGAEGNTVLRAFKTAGQPYAVAVDSDNNLYVAGAYVYVYGPNSTQPEREIENGVSVVYSIKIDGANNLFVGSDGDGAHITAYHPGELNPYLTITQGVRDPVSIDVGPAKTP